MSYGTCAYRLTNLHHTNFDYNVSSLRDWSLSFLCCLPQNYINEDKRASGERSQVSVMPQVFDSSYHSLEIEKSALQRCLPAF